MCFNRGVGFDEVLNDEPAGVHGEHMTDRALAALPRLVKKPANSARRGRARRPPLNYCRRSCRVPSARVSRGFGAQARPSLSIKVRKTVSPLRGTSPLLPSFSSSPRPLQPSPRSTICSSHASQAPVPSPSRAHYSHKPNPFHTAPPPPPPPSRRQCGARRSRRSIGRVLVATLHTTSRVTQVDRVVAISMYATPHGHASHAT